MNNERRTEARDLANKALEVYNRLARAEKIATENDSSRMDEISKLKKERAYFFIDQEMDDIMNEAEAVHHELMKERGQA
jgi:CO dehydrogenase/acetyl-CoA synthase beta subunit